jgi:hypothetical protein
MSIVRRSLAAAFVLGLALPAVSAEAEPAAWDQAKAAALSKQLAEAAKALQDTFYKQPTPTAGSMDSRDFYRLKQVVRRIRLEADHLQSELAKGTGLEETLPSYEDLMTSVRDAREIAQRTFITQDIKDRAATARTALNQLTPYYDPDAAPLQPATR